MAERAPWERVKEVLADALELPAAERRAFVAEACESEPALRDEVLSLLPDGDGAAQFLARPASEYFALGAPEVGSRIGGYTLRAVLGEGGMGRVFEAVQERPHRTVALKVLRPGAVSPAAEHRFRWEAEALGRLAHPAIARVLEAGIDGDAAPWPISWFAMEKVEGRPLLEAADVLGLDREARLALFARICDGVGHAHQRGVIHRDLKPENVLVDAAGAPHIVDFGIARVADPASTSVTTAGEVMGTLAYMSPEQVLGDADRVDVRTDVYSLGVLLYRLLTGKPPHALEGLGLAAIARKVGDEDPPPASRHDRSLRGDLDTILATALARDVERRYGSVDALAADVRAVLECRPISARPPTALYHLSKFARRHRGIVAAAASALVLLVAGTAGTSIGLHRAKVQEREAELARDEAVIQRDRAEKQIAFLRRMFQSADPRDLGRDTKVVDVLRIAGADLTADATLEEAVRASLHLTLGNTYRRLDDQEMALRHLGAAIDSLARAGGTSALDELDARAASVEALLALGRVDEARAVAAAFESRLAGLRADGAIAAPEPDWLPIRPVELAAQLAWAEGDRAASLADYRRAYDYWAEHAAPGSDAHETARSGLAATLLELGEHVEAEQLLRAGVAARTGELGPDHPAVLTQSSNLASALDAAGRAGEALAIIEELIPRAEVAMGARHGFSLTLRNNRASCLESLGRHEEASLEFEALVRIHAEDLGEVDRATLVARNNAAGAAMQLERGAVALEHLERVLAALDREGAPDDPYFRLRVRANHACALNAVGRWEEGLASLRAALAEYEELLGEGHFQALVARNNLAMQCLDAGRGAEAAELAKRNQQLAELHQPGHPVNDFPFRMNLGRALTAAGDFSGAEAALAASLAALAPTDREDSRRRVRTFLAELYDAWGRPDDAARIRAEDGPGGG